MNKQVRQLIEQAKLILGLRKKTVDEALAPLRVIVKDLKDAKVSAVAAQIAARREAAEALARDKAAVAAEKRADKSIKELSKAL